MKSLNAFCLLALAITLSASPIGIRSNKFSLSTNNAIVPSDSTANDPSTVIDNFKSDALFGGAGAGFGGKPSAKAVQAAVNNFASDATTVSASLNALPNTTDQATIKSLASKAFAAETDEDSQRATLIAAAGNAGAASNAKIVKFTPTVLDGLKAMMQNPTLRSVKNNVPAIEAARNPNILPSITQLSSSALQAMKLSATAQKFPATGQN